MPSHTRGKILEHLEGVHRNCEAIKEHCSKSIALVGDRNPTVTQTFIKLAELADVLDSFAQKTYGNI